ncbi:putative RNA methyltransferase [Amycolatopsis cihanbeyliensis]|uniref:23S rRNA (Guanine745-N1)-methyltransferase n=1 Tax=Amycolatopsis cihanbeyliensis TaxID=1128664 RepID=A0A542DGW5_AMYCI|nr:methyltransferase domain-containing protein [Amycolatopsis cihanbeyliensis]TQJ02325.1 23S rRNA (guanine745-N1)-methyltransferase [Amycolatopsis cihanbeyliensis]
MNTTGTRAPRLPSAVLRALRCSVCGERLSPGERAVRCPNRHSFDLAKQGYVNLLHAKVDAGTADTAEMVAARTEFLAAGHYARLAEVLAGRAADLLGGGLVLDAGGGTGYYLARVLDAVPAATGLALDVSAAALRRAARAHPRAGAAVWNLWQEWPLGTGVADLLLNVFAPRNAAEFHRVLRPGGALLVVSPGPDHLAELAGRLGLLAVDEDKRERLDTALAEYFTPAERTSCGGGVLLDPADARRAVLMGPNAHHLHRDGLADRLGALTEPIEVTTAFEVSTYLPRTR